MTGPAASAPAPSTDDDRPIAVFRLPRSAYLPVLFLGLGVTVLVRSPLWLLVYLVPVAVAVFVARRSTVIDSDAITVRALFAQRRMPWDQVRGLLVDDRGNVSAALTDGTSVRLAYVRARHLPVLSAVTGNRIPAMPARPDQ